MSDPRDDVSSPESSMAEPAESEATVEEVTAGERHDASLDDFPVTAPDGTLVAPPEAGPDETSALEGEPADELAAAPEVSEDASPQASPAAPIAEEDGTEPFVETPVSAEEAEPGSEPAVAALTAEEPAAEAATAALAPEPAAVGEESGDGSTGGQQPNESQTEEPASAELLVLRDAMEKNEPVEGQVIGWNKGGYHVALGRIAAFCPVSQIEIGSPRAPKKYLDRAFKFNVLEIQSGGRRVVVSRAAALKVERETRAREVKERFKPGAVIDGKVSSLTDFGAFVDLGGGVEGLVHVSEISCRRVEHPKEVLQVGQEVKVEVLKVEKRGQRISLSMKRLEVDPWEGVAERFTSGDAFEGKILRKTEFGLFVEVEPGLEGLVHLSRLPHGTTLESDGLDVGTTVKGWIQDVDPKRRRLSLSLREVAKGNPWQGIGDRLPVGSMVDGTVERLAPFGAFIELEPGITGLLPFSSVASTGPGSNPKRQYHVGREVKVKVLSVDRARKRISLGTEQSKAEGSEADYREYIKAQQESSGGLGTLAAAFQKLKASAEG